MNYQETLEFLYCSLPMFQRVGGAAYKANLDNTQALDAYFDHPHRHFLTIHVAGTNGKGSCSHLLASVLQCAGYKTGLYTSPHLKDFRERIKINGEMMPQQEVVDFVEKHQAIVAKLSPSFFEMTVAMAFDYFARQRVDVAVIEVGMGGRLDSTNIIRPLVSVITNIGYDHMQFLGNTLPEIASEKAGIMKSGVPVVIGETDPETAPVFRASACRVGAPCVFADARYVCTASRSTGRCQILSVRSLCDRTDKEISVDLLGDYQCRNVPTVLTALDELRAGGVLRISDAAILEGLASGATRTGLRGRWQILREAPLTVCDTGHNEAGLRFVTAQLARQTYHKLYFVLGVVNDKDLSKILPLLPQDAHYIFTQASLERALPAEVLAERAATYGLHGEIAPTIPEAVARAHEQATPADFIFIGGSTFTVAEVLD